MFEQLPHVSVDDAAWLGDEFAAAVVALEAAVERLAGADPGRCAESVVLEGLGRLTGVVSRLEAQRLRLIREADARGGVVTRGGGSVAGWLHSALLVRRGAAGRQAGLAEALRAGHRLTWAALESGRISVDAAEVIVRAIEGLPPDLPAGKVAEAETFLLEQAAEHDPAALARLGRHLRAVLDPEDGARRARFEEDAAGSRELHLSTDPYDGMLHVRGWLDPEAGSLLRTALEPFTAPRPAADGRPDPRTAARRNADALTELVGGVLDGRLPTSGSERPHLSVTLSLESLREGVGGGLVETEWATPLSPEAARRLACDARVIPVVLGSAGEPLDVGRASYVVPAGMRRALVTRDRGCAFPSCDRPPAWCHAHHIQHWASGGATRIGNLVLLCGQHHRLIHAGGWQVALGPDGIPEFTPPPWIDPLQTPRRTPLHNRLTPFRAPSHDPPGVLAS